MTIGNVNTSNEDVVRDNAGSDLSCPYHRGYCILAVVLPSPLSDVVHDDGIDGPILSTMALKMDRKAARRRLCVTMLLLLLVVLVVCSRTRTTCRRKTVLSMKMVAGLAVTSRRQPHNEGWCEMTMTATIRITMDNIRLVRRNSHGDLR